MQRPLQLRTKHAVYRLMTTGEVVRQILGSEQTTVEPKNGSIPVVSLQ